MRKLDARERLEVLRRVDTYRQWYSIDDKRICAICEKVINGWQIEISGEPGAYTLRCPTKECPSNISHWWFLHQLADARVGAAPLAAA